MSIPLTHIIQLFLRLEVFLIQYVTYIGIYLWCIRGWVRCINIGGGAEREGEWGGLEGRRCDVWRTVGVRGGGGNLGCVPLHNEGLPVE